MREGIADVDVLRKHFQKSQSRSYFRQLLIQLVDFVIEGISTLWISSKILVKNKEDYV